MKGKGSLQDMKTGYGVKSEVKVTLLSRVPFFATPWTVAYQASLSMGFSRQEYWNGLPFPSPGSLPNPGIEPGSPELQTDTLLSEPQGSPVYGVWKRKKHIESTQNRLVNEGAK